MDAAASQRARMTEDIHQQSVGTHARVQFPPSPISSRETVCGTGVNLAQAAGPLGISPEGTVARVEKVSVLLVAGLVNHDSIVSVAANVS